MHERINEGKVFSAPMTFTSGQRRNISLNRLLSSEAKNVTTWAPKTAHAVYLLALLAARDEKISPRRNNLTLAVDALG